MSVAGAMRLSSKLSELRIADLSHTDHATQRQALEVAEAPLIFSHSSW